MTISKTLVEQERKPSQKIINTSNFDRVLHRVTYKANPETRQRIMIPARGTIHDSKLLNLTCNDTLSLASRMAGEDEPGKPKMTPVTKLVAWKIPFVE